MTAATNILSGTRTAQILVLTALVTCVSFGQTAALANQDEAEWNRIRETKSDGELLAYIEKYPSSKFADFAYRRIDQLAWEKVDKSNPDAVKDFLRRYPDLQVEIPVALQARLTGSPETATPSERTGASRTIEGIDKTLRDLSVAYGTRNIEAVKSIWPSLSSDALKRTQQLFKDASSISMKLEPTAPAIIDGDYAIAVCRQTLDTAQADKTKIATSLVSLKMKRIGQQWLIESMQ